MGPITTIYPILMYPYKGPWNPPKRAKGPILIRNTAKMRLNLQAARWLGGAARQAAVHTWLALGLGVLGFRGQWGYTGVMGGFRV